MKIILIISILLLLYAIVLLLSHAKTMKDINNKIYDDKLNEL